MQWFLVFFVCFVLFFPPLDWKIFARMCEYRAPPHPGVCSLHNRLTASPFRWEGATESMEIGQDIPKNGWRPKEDLPNHE